MKDAEFFRSAWDFDVHCHKVDDRAPREYQKGEISVLK